MRRKRDIVPAGSIYFIVRRKGILLQLVVFTVGRKRDIVPAGSIYCIVRRKRDFVPAGSIYSTV